MDMGFKNIVGGAKEQAMAMSNRQFYRDCSITSTMDFIFGNSAIVLQNYKIMPRKPLPNRFLTITAQGKKDPNKKSEISIQKCDITPLNNLTTPTYLGRPWKGYSTTVIMQSRIGGFLHPLGWVEWDKGVEPPSSIFDNVNQLVVMSVQITINLWKMVKVSKKPWFYFGPGGGGSSESSVGSLGKKMMNEIASLNGSSFSGETKEETHGWSEKVDDVFSTAEDGGGGEEEKGSIVFQFKGLTHSWWVI
ncbi:Pectinesterase, catalytic [Cynara cardunculus var. scolymus]|uniref:Pectinesterase, catalytic n=1 Tax=Cynara cardunculus var. scolymus TaxID=59895 RepID=A0A103YFW9_CYNCS|nr:Pectinesterase, catalytic [Cynara cardunculus var. scolymus]